MIKMNNSNNNNNNDNNFTVKLSKNEKIVIIISSLAFILSFILFLSSIINNTNKILNKNENNENFIYSNDNANYVKNDESSKSQVKYKFDNKKNNINFNFGKLYDDESIYSISLVVEYEASNDRCNINLNEITNNYLNNDINKIDSKNYKDETDKFYLFTIKNIDIANDNDLNNFNISFKPIGSAKIINIIPIKIETNLGTLYYDKNLENNIKTYIYNPSNNIKDNNNNSNINSNNYDNSDEIYF